MSDVPVWRLFAYMSNDPDGTRDHKRNLADWQVEDVLRWCRFRGYDTIILDRDPVETTSFAPVSSAPVVHISHFAGGSDDEQGGAAA